MKDSAHVFFNHSVPGQQVLFTRDFLKYLYIFSPIKRMFYGKYVLCVARQSRGGGKWLWSGHGPWKRKRDQSKGRRTEMAKRKKRKIKNFLIWIIWTNAHTHTHARSHTLKKEKCSNKNTHCSVPADVLCVVIRWWECATAR